MKNSDDENKDLECVNCGGKEFTKEGGFYFCTECQTQSQDIREQVFEQTQNENVQVYEKKLTIRKDNSGNDTKKLTSWETFNYILYGLVEEFKILGADDNFKQVVYHLWMEYLTRLECISENKKIPKLGCTFRKRDVEIVYQRKFKKKRKKVALSTVSDGMDDRLKIKERAKKRKLMEKKEYDTISVTSSTTATSLANQTLSTLSTDDESTPGQIYFSESCRQELLKHMTSKHLELHLKDAKSEMTCHSNYRKYMSNKYMHGPQILTKNKLYSLLYLGMILTQQEFQISDIIRYCREGHISFLIFKHFFPDSIDENLVDHSAYSGGKKEFPSYDFMRHFTYELYTYLELRPCDMSPNMIKLCRRYCTELNLPDHIFNMTAYFIEKSRPFQLTKFSGRIPNYEGRCMAFIIYSLKVLFGFDDYTEYELSKFAHLVNNNPNKPKEQPKLFNFLDWFDYIEYRKLVLKYIHFPTWYLLEPDKDCPLDLYVKMISHKYAMFDLEENSNLRMNVVKKLLGDLENCNLEKLIVFEPSLTPFRSYIDKILQMKDFKVKNEIVNKQTLANASNFSIDYLINPNNYLKQIDAENCKFLYCNAHPKHEFVKIKYHFRHGTIIENNFDIFVENWNKTFFDIKKNQISLILLKNKVLKNTVQNTPTKPPEKIIAVPQNTKLEVKAKVNRNSKGRFCSKSEENSMSIDEYPNRLKYKKWRVSKWHNTELPHVYKPSFLYEQEVQNSLKEYDETKKLNEDKYKYHYIPHMEYIFNSEPKFMQHIYYEKVEKTLPKNFLWLLEECGRILEQPAKMIFEEFSKVEIYMNYIYYNKTPHECPPLVNDVKVNQFIKHVAKKW